MKAKFKKNILKTWLSVKKIVEGIFYRLYGVVFEGRSITKSTFFSFHPGAVNSMEGPRIGAFLSDYFL